VDDPHRKPGDKDREALAARIKHAADEGRIGAADRDIRLGNVSNAQSMAELDLMTRDLDQLESTLPVAPPAVAAPAGPAIPPVAEEIADKAVGVAKSTARSFGVIAAVILAMVVVGAGATTFFASRGSDSGDVTLFEPEPIPSDATDDPVDDPSSADPNDPPTTSGAKYALTVAGIRSFLAGYRSKFDTTEVVDLVLYDEYVIVQVPIAGKNRHAGFLFRPSDGWQDFGGVRANFPGAQTVDVRKLDVQALVRNIARARRTLNVEDPSTTYAIVRHYGSADEVPSVDIHVANQYSESGYLATTLDGTVERAYPYGG
jgi:hypothetical protein